jgi:hypothetical protein
VNWAESVIVPRTRTAFYSLVLRMSEKERVEAMESNSHMAVKGFWKHNKASCAELAGELIVPVALTGKLVPVLRDCFQVEVCWRKSGRSAVCSSER